MVTYCSEVPRPRLILWARWPLFPHASSLIIIILTIFMQNLTSFKNWWKVPLFKNETKGRLLPICLPNPPPPNPLQLLHCPDLVFRFSCFWPRGNPSSNQQVWALPKWMVVFHPNSIHHVVGQGGWENGNEGIHPKQNSCDGEQNVKKCNGYKGKLWLARRKQWAPPGETTGTSGICDVVTDIIIKVMSEAELCAYIMFIIIQISLKQDAVHLTLTPFDWFLPFSLLSLFLSFLPFISARTFRSTDIQI